MVQITKIKIKAKNGGVKKGDLVETPPNEMHALKIGKNEFIVFTMGKRGGRIMKMIPIDSHH